MKKKRKRLQLRLETGEYVALKLIAARNGVTMSSILVAHIRKLAKDKKVPL